MAIKSKVVADWRGIASLAILVLTSVAFHALGNDELAKTTLAAAIGGAVLPTLAKSVSRGEDPS